MRNLPLHKQQKLPPRVIYPILLLLLLLTMLGSMALGKYSASIPEILEIMWRKLFGLTPTWSGNTEVALFNIRIPRVIAAALVGGALSVSGAVYQGLFRNPMVSPDILGASDGAGFGA